MMRIGELLGQRRDDSWKKDYLARSSLRAGVILEIWCQRCYRPFMWEVPEDTCHPPSYCSRACKRRTQAIDRGGDCPRPDKVAYSDSIAATVARDAVAERDEILLSVYHCLCGAFHVGRILGRVC